MFASSSNTNAQLFVIGAEPCVMHLFAELSGVIEAHPDIIPVLERDMKDSITVKAYCEVLVACFPPFAVSQCYSSRQPYHVPKSRIVTVLACLVPLFEALLDQVRAHGHMRGLEYQMDDPIRVFEMTETLITCAMFSMHKKPLVVEPARPRNSASAGSHSGSSQTRAAT